MGPWAGADARARGIALPPTSKELLAEAFVKFTGDDGEFLEAVKRVVGASKAGAEEASDAFRKAFQGGPQRGQEAPQDDQRWGATLLRVRQLREGADQADTKLGTLSRTAGRLAGGLVGQVSPALGGTVGQLGAMTAGVTTLSFALGGSIVVLSLVAIGLATYISRMREARALAVDLAVALRQQDFGAVASQAKALSDEVEKSLENRRRLAQGANQDLRDARAYLDVIVSFYELQATRLETIGTKQQALRERTAVLLAEAARQEASFEGPKRRLDALVEEQRLVQSGLALRLRDAGSIDTLRATTDRLIASKRQEARLTAEQIKLDAERQAFIDARTPAAFGGKTADQVIGELTAADQKARNVLRQADTDIQSIRRDEVTSLVEIETRRLDFFGKERDRNAERVAQAISISRALVEVEATVTRGLEEGIRARSTMLAAEEQAQLALLRTHTASRVAVLRQRAERLPIGSPEQIEAERELTHVLRDEQAKRQTIESTFYVQKVQMAEQARQQLIALDESVFQLEKALGAKRLEDELERQRQMAVAAKTGTDVQIAALQRVAEIQKQIQDQARGLVGGALSLFERQLQRLGLNDGIVSLRSLERAQERQRELNDQTRLTLSSGGVVRASELRNLLGDASFFDEVRKSGKSLSEAFSDAFTPVEQAVKDKVGQPLLDAVTFVKDQLSGQKLFDPERFLGDFLATMKGLAPTVQEGLAPLTDVFKATFDRIEGLGDVLVKNLVDKIGPGLVRNLTDQIEETLARDLAAAPRQ